MGRDWYNGRGGSGGFGRRDSRAPRGRRDGRGDWPRPPLPSHRCYRDSRAYEGREHRGGYGGPHGGRERRDYAGWPCGREGRAERRPERRSRSRRRSPVVPPVPPPPPPRPTPTWSEGHRAPAEEPRPPQPQSRAVMPVPPVPPPPPPRVRPTSAWDDNPPAPEEEQRPPPPPSRPVPTHCPKEPSVHRAEGRSSSCTLVAEQRVEVAQDVQVVDSASRSMSAASGSASGSSSDQDDIIHFSWQQGMVMNDRYNLLKLLGDGTFGRVVLAQDQCTQRQVAIKIIRDVKRYADNAKIEADILKDIRQADPHGSSGCAIMYETFMHERRFYCLVFEPLGASLYDFLKANAFRGFWMQDIQSFAQQSMQALSFLHGQLRMAHTDLKPENILLTSMAQPYASHFPREAEWLRRNASSSSKQAIGDYMRPINAQIKLIDFGNATYEDEHHSSIINTRQYRGPEVLLSLGWDERSDLWSIGCILMELYSGEQLFATHEEVEHLALMQRIIGPLPPRVLDHASQSARESYLTTDPRTGQLRLPWPERASSPSSERHVCSQRPLPEHVLPQHALLADFCRALLALDPQGRPSATQAQQHPLFSHHFPD